jgi:hypothetical protein
VLDNASANVGVNKSANQFFFIRFPFGIVLCVW